VPQQEFDGSSSGEVTPLSSLTASFNSSPLSSQAVSDDEGDNDDGFLTLADAVDDLSSSGETKTSRGKVKKLDKAKRDHDLTLSGESRTPYSSPAPRRCLLHHLTL
jgi:hypothetical protein